MYFESNLSAIYDIKNSKYIIPSKGRDIECFDKIIEYLEHYGFDYELDDNAEKLKQKKESAEKKFEEIKKKALEIKRSPDKYNLEINKFTNLISAEMNRQLIDLQLLSAYHLAVSENGANFSVPGSGKTTIVYATYSFLKKRGIVDRLMVIGPISCFIPWEEEHFLCFGKKVKALRLAGHPVNERDKLYYLSDKYELFLNTYHTAANDREKTKYLLSQKKFLLVLDESHYIKRFDSGYLSNAVLEIAPFAERRFILTGTPAPNSYADLWTQFTFLWPKRKILGNRPQFISKIPTHTVRYDDDWLKEKTLPFFFRIKKSDLSLPPIEFKRISIPMNPIQNQIYRAIATKFLSQIVSDREDRVQVRELRKAKIIRLLQVASNPTLLAKSSEEFRVPPMKLKEQNIRNLVRRYPDIEVPSKFEKLSEIVKNLVSKGEKVIIWTYFVHNINMLKLFFKDLKPLFVFGGIPRSEEENEQFNREKIINVFKNDPQRLVLIANPAACGESISLHKICHNAIYIDRTFNCAHFLQSLDRIHRLGLSKDIITSYYLLICENSIDEVVEKRLMIKKENMESLINEDLPVLNMDIMNDNISDDLSEEVEDFKAVLEHLKERK